MNAHEEAFAALMKEIKANAERIPGSSLPEGQKAPALRDLAAAYRHLRGGPQPGSISLEK